MIKRLFDFLLATTGLIFLAPLLFLVVVVIRLHSRGPGFFTQVRIGRGGQPFRILKFRTMVAGAQEQGPLLTVGEDSRITRLGRFLRSSKLDELPQLWNVVIGDMSLVGPRPEVQKYVELYSEAQRQVLQMRPGITDPASLALFNESELLARSNHPEEFYVRQLMPEKIRINLAYANRASVWTDLVLILLTIGKAFGFHIDIFSRLQIAPPQFRVDL